MTSIFKISIGGASVEGQSNWGQKIVAFLAGWVFVMIGGFFHGVEMYIKHESNNNLPSVKQPSQANIILTKNEKSKDIPLQNSTQPSAPQKSEIDVSGLWQDVDGFRYQITQVKNELEIICLTPEGITVGEGAGEITGRIVNLKVVIAGNSATCKMRLLTGAQLSGPCSIEILGITGYSVWNKLAVL